MNISKDTFFILSMNTHQDNMSRGKIPPILNKTFPKIDITSLPSLYQSPTLMIRYIAYFLDELSDIPPGDFDALVLHTHEVIRSLLSPLSSPIQIRILKRICHAICISLKHRKPLSQQERISPIYDIIFHLIFSSYPLQDIPHPHLPNDFPLPVDQFLWTHAFQQQAFCHFDLPPGISVSSVLSTLEKQFQVHPFCVPPEDLEHILLGRWELSFQQDYNFSPGYLTQLVKDAQDHPTKNIIIWIDNFHHYTSKDIVFLNELLEKREFTTKDNQHMKLPSNLTITFCSKGELQVDLPEMSRLISYRCFRLHPLIDDALFVIDQFIHNPNTQSLLKEYLIFASESQKNMLSSPSFLHVLPFLSPLKNMLKNNVPPDIIICYIHHYYHHQQCPQKKANRPPIYFPSSPYASPHFPTLTIIPLYSS